MGTNISCASHLVKHTVNHDDTSPHILCGMKDGTRLVHVIVEVTETWNDGSKAFTVGDASNPDGFVEDLGAGLESTGYKALDHDTWGAYLWHLAGSHKISKVYTGSDNILATFVGVGDGGSQGQCIVYIFHEDLK